MADSPTNDYLELVVDIHDRQYQRYSIDNSVYHLPVDEEEEDRLEEQHRVFHYLFDGKLYFPPLEYPRKVLDCGYGQGSWAVAMAETYTESVVSAVDIWRSDLPDVPDNLDIQFWNLNDPLTQLFDPNTFDLIHSRCVGPGIKRSRWNSYIRELARLLRRGGWLQMAEYYYNIQSDTGRLGEDHAMYKWGVTYRGLMEVDRDPRVGRHLVEKLRNAGLHDIHSRSYQIPIGPWPRDPTQQRIGALNLQNIDKMLDSLALWPFTQRGAYTSAQQVGWLTDQARQEARDPTLKLYIPIDVVWARKR